MRRVLSIPFLSALLATAIMHGCGKELDESSQAGQEGPNEDGMTLVNGAAPFASQCPYGSFSRPVDTPVSLWDCNLGMRQVELERPLRPLIIQADCKKKLVYVRSTDGKLDTLWEVMPDNSFFFTVDGGQAIMKNDGSGNSSCATQLTAEMFGTLDCTDRDRVTIKLETVWWLDRAPPSPTPSPSPTPIPTPTPTITVTPTPTVTPTVTPTTTPTPTRTPTPGPTNTPVTVLQLDRLIQVNPTPSSTHVACKIPRGCYFYAAANIRQCE